jgi:hypothetical protein
MGTWVADIWNPFYDRYREQPASPEVLRQGSWKKVPLRRWRRCGLPENPGEPATALAFGDSVALCIRRAAAHPERHTSRISRFLTPPPMLLNWKTEPPDPEGFSIRTLPTHPGAVLLVWQRCAGAAYPARLCFALSALDDAVKPGSLWPDCVSPAAPLGGLPRKPDRRIRFS